MNHIGQLNEQHLHNTLKFYYAGTHGETEILVDGYVVDVVTDNHLIEIQTGNFFSIKKKLVNLVAQHRTRLVYPIASEKWLLKLPKPGWEQGKRRKSPKRGRLVDVFGELVSFPALIKEPNFSLELVMIQEEEVRRYVGEDQWYQNGWETVERRLIKVLDRKVYESPRQMAGLLPTGLPGAFTTADLAAELAIPRWLAQKMAYCLREMGAIHWIGKKRRSNLYVVDGLTTLD